MPTAKTTDDLLTDVRARVAAPTANGLLSSSEILALADQEMRTELAALLIGLRSEYWLADYTTAIVSGTSSYRLPERALAMGLRDVTVYDAAGREWNVPQISADQRYLWSQRQTNGAEFVFCLDNGSLVLLPTPTANSAGYTLRMRYYVRPSQLTLVSDAARVTGIGQQDVPGAWSDGSGLGNNVLDGDTSLVVGDETVYPPSGDFYVRIASSTVESDFALANGVGTFPSRVELVSPWANGPYEAGDGLRVDYAPVAQEDNPLELVLAASPPATITTTGTILDLVRGGGMYEAIASDLVVAGWDSGASEIEFAEALTADQLASVSIAPTATAAGGRRDYLCVAGTTVYPPIPESMWPLLVALTCRAYCEAVGDMRGIAAAAEMYERKKTAALSIMQPRVDGEVRRPVPMNTPLRGGRYRGRGWAW